MLLVCVCVCVCEDRPSPLSTFTSPSPPSAPLPVAKAPPTERTQVSPLFFPPFLQHYQLIPHLPPSLPPVLLQISVPSFLAAAPRPDLHCLTIEILLLRPTFCCFAHCFPPHLPFPFRLRKAPGPKFLSSPPTFATFSAISSWLDSFAAHLHLSSVFKAPSVLATEVGQFV